MKNISDLNALNSANGVNLSSFAFMGVGSKKYKTGSHIDQSGVNLNAGIAKSFESNALGEILGGAFIELGYAKYESSIANGFVSEGNTKFFGLGVMGQKDFANDFYANLALRIGKVMSDYENTINLANYNIDYSALYYGANLGGEKFVNLNSSNTLYIYAKYFFSHTNSDEIQTNGSNLKFDAVNAHQITLGAKDNIALDNKNQIYGGANVNYKFGGESKGRIEQGFVVFDIPSPSLKGTYFGLNAGFERAQSDNLNLSIGAKAYFGKEQGIGANLGVEYKF